jgi:protein O-mannosyl-transferase
MHIITSKEFVHTFCDIWNSNDRRICFVLGAGASKSSGIRTGGELAKQWLDEIEVRMQDQPAKLEDFLTTHKINRANPGLHYPEIYKERFRLDYDTGFEFINREMEAAKPGYGYSVLAQILAEKQHNIIITTNFDNLSEEALYTYTNKRPLICGHESLAVFAKPSVKRPLIVKIHRDRFFNPQSLREEISTINKLWVDALNSIFANSTPVFIGYGGNDGSLMGYLEEINNFQNIFWCERKGVQASDRVAALLQKFNGKLVEIEGFDELMFLLQDGLRLKLLHQEIVDIANERSRAYKDTVGKIRKSQASSTDIDAQEAAARIVDRADGDPWQWHLKAEAANSPEEKDKIYKEAITKFPNSSELNHYYGMFLASAEKPDEAEEYFKKALQLNPENDDACISYGEFLENVRQNYDLAEDFYRKALQINRDALTCTIYAMFLTHTRQDFAQARNYYLEAITLAPNDPFYYYQYASALETNEENDEAERYFLEALKVAPDDPVANLWYAQFLDHSRQRYDKAEKYYLKAVKLKPDDVNANKAYAEFLINVREQPDKAKPYQRKALPVETRETTGS